jgi:hypothetical protein
MSSDSSSNVGAIVGACVGTVLAIGFVVAVVYVAFNTLNVHAVFGIPEVSVSQAVGLVALLSVAKLKYSTHD